MTPRHLLRSLSVVLVVMLAAVTGGCSLLGDGAPQFDAGREGRVAADPDATAAQIITVGGPTAVATRPGMTLVAWAADTDTSEGPQQGAWRLYGSDGRRIADGTLGQVFEAAAVPDLLAVPDGFVIADYTGAGLRHVAEDGTLTVVPRSRRQVPTRPGDVLVPGLTAAGTLVYRPSLHQAFGLPRLPFPQLQRIAIDRTGRLWAQQLWGRRTAPVSSSADGTEPWTRTEVPLAVDGQPQSLVVVRGRVVVSTAVATGSAEPALDAVWTRPVGGDPAAPWQRQDATGVRLQEPDPEIGALPDGRLVVSGANQQMYLERQDGRFARLSPPDGLRSSSLSYAGDGLYLVETTDDELYRSADGTAWHPVKR